MIFYHVLDEVFSTWSNIAVLRVLQDTVAGMSGREIARQAMMSHRSCHKALAHLENLSIVVCQRGAREHFFSLNREHLLVLHGILPILKLERGFLNQLGVYLKKNLASSTISVILFGSVARREESITSDVDICLIVNRVSEKKKIRERIHTFSSVVKRRFGAQLSPIIFSAAEFLQRAQKNKSPVREIMKDGIVICGTPLRKIIHG